MPRAEPGELKYDVFLSHRSQAAVVRDVANRLKSDGVRGCCDEWEIGHGSALSAPDSARLRAAKTDDGPDGNGVLVLCMSTATLTANWPQSDRYTSPLQRPVSEDRRFVPMRRGDVRNAFSSSRKPI